MRRIEFCRFKRERNMTKQRPTRLERKLIRLKLLVMAGRMNCRLA
jgi:hypothetical protein